MALTKSKERVRKYGEVFTPDWVVNKMLDQPEILEQINNLNSNILEPSAGEGAFLLELLKRRMDYAYKVSKTKDEYNEAVLTGLSGLYGIELLEDDYKVLVDNMIAEFKNNYTYNDNNVINSAIFIIKKNLLNGNTLKFINNNNDPLIINEWNISNHRVQRNEYIFNDSLNEKSKPITSHFPINLTEAFHENKLALHV